MGRRCPPSVTITLRAGYLFGIPVNGFWRECRGADGEVLGAVGLRCTVADPLAARADYSLSRTNLENTSAVLDLKHASDDHGEFVEFRSLPRLLPPCRTLHSRNT